MSDVNRDQIVHLAKLAHINLTEEELDRVSGEIEEILDSVARVQEVATNTVFPTSHPISLTNVFREDTVGEVLSQDDVLSGAAQSEDGRFKVPAILEDDEPEESQ